MAGESARATGCGARPSFDPAGGGHFPGAGCAGGSPAGGRGPVFSGLGRQGPRFLASLDLPESRFGLLLMVRRFGNASGKVGPLDTRPLWQKGARSTDPETLATYTANRAGPWRRRGPAGLGVSEVTGQGQSEGRRFRHTYPTSRRGPCRCIRGTWKPPDRRLYRDDENVP